MRKLISVKSLLFLLAILFTSCAYKHNDEDSVSKRKNIPSDAFFVKGNIGGYWCQAKVHDHKNNAFLNVYDGLTGKLLKAKRFSVICIVHGNPLWIDDLKNQIDYFDGEKFHLKRLPGQDSCWLQALQ